MKIRTLIFTLLFCSTAFANDLYQVEVVVFQNNDPQAVSNEAWPSHPALPETQGSLELTEESGDGKPYQLLPKTAWELSPAIDKLRRSKYYSVLLHIAWRQPIDNAHAQPIHIYSLGPIDNDSEGHLVKFDAGLPLKLDGTIAIRKPKKFWVKADLVLNLPQEEAQQRLADTTLNNAVLAREIANFRLSQHAYLRPAELYYFDNPLYGMLIKIRPAPAEKSPAKLSSAKTERPVSEH